MTQPTTDRAMVVITGDDIHHDLISASLVFQQLGIEAGFATRRAAGTGRFVDARAETAGSDVFVFYTSGGQFAPAQQAALAAAVSGGKGLVAIHASNVMPAAADGGLDEDFRAYYELLGNRYLSHGPGHHEGRHTIEIVGEHPITAGIDDFELFDEYYEFEMADDDVQVLAQRHREDGVVIPVLYARSVGAGRVVYLALGHDMRAWGEPAFRQLVTQAINWAAGRDS
jgi:type 1 glutamine amidotransferase